MLVTACILSLGWLRSIGRMDVFHLCLGRTLFAVASRNCAICVYPSRYQTHATAISKSIAINNSPLKRSHIGILSERSSNKSNLEYWTERSPNSLFTQNVYWKTNDFVLLTESHTTLSDERETLLVVAPYWSIAVPLSLLSAYLLVSKPLAAKTRPPHAGKSPLQPQR